MKREEARNQQIIEYYDSCEIDYRTNWHLDQCLAMHIGYWDKTTTTLPQALIRQKEVMLLKAKISKADLVLDAGCGVGGSSIFMAKDCGCMVVGITLSSNQALSAKNYSKEQGTGPMTDFQVMDFSNTGFADESFDVVWALESVCHADSKKNLFVRRTGY